MKRTALAPSAEKADDVRWTCQCGESGWMRPKHFSLAGQVRQVRMQHQCADPDIERLETRSDYDSRIYHSRFHAGVI